GWAAGVFRDSDNYGKNSGDGKYAFTGRVVFAPVYSKEQKRVIHLGFSGSSRNPNGGVVRYSRKPEVNLAPNFVSTPSIAAKRVNLFGVETLVSQGRFFAQAEGIGSRVTRTGGGSATFTGGYAYAGWFLTNDHRPYKPGQGVADRVVPARNFDPRKSEWGALAVAARVSYLDLDDSGIKGGTLTDGTLGLDWFLNPNTSVKAGYVIARPKGAGAMSAFQLRAQFDF
ncbi:MAG TPA: porin, partial [Candidatus Latescibacteria bacterium]|nr:porin [Candidatus Latescibacterota bacterium]